MNNLSSYTPSVQLDFEALPTTVITLESVDIEEAARICSQIPNESRQWQIYLHALALFAVEKWLEERASLTVNREKCTILQPPLANIINAVCNLQVGDFKLCLLTIGSLTDEHIDLSRIVVDLPEFVNHFYVLVEVVEEHEYVVVRGFLSYQQLLSKCGAVQADWNYQLPLFCVEEPDNLLLYLRCLESEAIPLPKVSNNHISSLSKTQNELTKLLPLLSSPERELWEVLTWEQATVVITNPELVQWVYTLQTQNVETHDSASLHIVDLLKLITQPALNVGRWLWDELDNTAKELSWILLPSLLPTSQMRPTKEEFEAIITEIQHQGLEIPSQARGAYHDFSLAGIPLRLYAATWYLMSESNQPEWTLLLILGASSQGYLPHNVKLRVSDQTSILVDKELDAQSEDAYLFTRVVGSWDEKFVVSVSLINGVEVTLPPFAFDLGRGEAQ
jgi:hypothetical protein